IFGLTKVKESLLKQEYDNWSRYLRWEDVPLYSATKQQVQRVLKRLNEKHKQRQRQGESIP
ncbi:MAG: hypothetical protein ACK4FV_01065, partial [Candidatus Nitrosocaldus sp.]